VQNRAQYQVNRPKAKLTDMTLAHNFKALRADEFVLHTAAIVPASAQNCVDRRQCGQDELMKRVQLAQEEAVRREPVENVEAKLAGGKDCVLVDVELE